MTIYKPTILDAEYASYKICGYNAVKIYHYFVDNNQDVCPAASQSQVVLSLDGVRKLNEKFGWIDVKETLPEHCIPVIVTDGKNVEEGLWHKVHGWIDFPFRNKIEVTHWMPLPKPPYQKNEQT